MQAATFLHLSGSEAHRIYDTFEFASEEDRQKLAPLKDRFAGYCQPQKNLTYLRHQFFIRSQAPGESFDHFLLDLRSKGKHCEFGDLHDSLFRDRLMAGVHNDAVRVRLLHDTDLTLKLPSKPVALRKPACTNCGCFNQL